MTASDFIKQLSAKKTKADAENNSKHFKDTEDKKNKFLGVRMGTIFALAKKFSDLEVKEISKLLDSDFYEVRVGAVSIMDFQARNKKTAPEIKKELFDLYIKKHNRINNWDLVDRSAPYVVGGYLYDKPRKILYKLAKSKNVWERRTAIVSTYFFIRQSDILDTFKIAELLVKDKHELIHTAVGSWIREAGKKDKLMLTGFLDKYASSMPRIMLRYAVEKLDKKTKDHYLLKLKSPKEK
jgi:3-methyladenine DNA glycosylase AlkD